MSMIKNSTITNPVIISKMVFICQKCGAIEIADEDSYDPKIEVKCPKCDNTMVISSAETSTDKTQNTEENKE